MARSGGGQATTRRRCRRVGGVVVVGQAALTTGAGEGARQGNSTADYLSVWGAFAQVARKSLPCWRGQAHGVVPTLRHQWQTNLAGAADRFGSSARSR